MLTAGALLETWECSLPCRPAGRAQALLALALPGQTPESLARVDPGLRDWHLLRLRCALFGATLSAAADCPTCGEQLEVEFDAAAVDGRMPPEAVPFTSSSGRRYRLPTAGDLMAVGGLSDPETAARALFERCRSDAAPDPPGDECDEFDEVDSGLAALAAERGIQVELSCPACAQPSRHRLDAAEFLWAEIAAAAGALLDDVHRLAWAYGWTERDILAMSAERRAAYCARMGS